MVANLTMTRSGSPPLLLRILYFFLVGFWLTGIWINVAWLLNVSIIGLPFGLWMLDRVPQVLTLRAKSSTMEVGVRDGRPLYVRESAVPQRPLLIRAIYFVLIGWWLSLLWSNLAWFLCLTIVGLPVGIPMFNYLPAVTTLMRN